jgi:cation diffusion facilitator CzcD-associated flavoprotein CzcO
LQTDVAIIGLGFGGIGLGIKLRQAGWHDFHIFEQASSLGGTWRDNTYPGAACDVPSHLYSFSFEPNPKWTKAFAPQSEILDYLEHCVKKYKLEKNTTFDTQIKSAHFDEKAGMWTLTTTQGRKIKTKVVVAATGALNKPAYPNIQGLDNFKGVKFHTAEWDHSFDLKGKSVAVIGTGASAIQVVPGIAPTVGRLSLFQRTPPWVMPKFDHAIGPIKKWSYSHIPLTQNIARKSVYLFGELVTPIFLRDSFLSRAAESLGKRFIRSQIKSANLQAKVTPDYRIGCKRVLLSDDYYAALNGSNVEVVSDGIKEVTADGIITEQGEKKVVDAIIMATGFKVPVASAPFDVYGLNGRDLNKEWAQGSEAYKGISVTGYPNFALIMGPNTGPGNTSVIFYIESQINYIMKFLNRLNVANIAFMDVQPEAQKEFVKMIDERMEKTVWTSGCQSWYLTENGRNTSLWPGFSSEYRMKTSFFESSKYNITYAEPRLQNEGNFEDAMSAMS